MDKREQQISTLQFLREAAIRCCGLNDYRFIITRIRTSDDISKDTAFQRRFTYFYRVRRPMKWLRDYYCLFETMRHRSSPGFKEILSAIASFSDNRVEISFASKMLATIDPDFPIWDKYVRENLGLPDIPPPRSPDRFEQAVSCYDLLVERMRTMLASEAVRREVDEFDRVFPKYAGFSPMKKLDYLVWGVNRVDA